MHLIGVTAPTLLFVKREISEDVYDIAPQHLSDMVKARMPESQSPAVQSHARREHVYVPAPLRATDYLSVCGRSCSMGDEKRSH
jgi:hypothetical protein